MTKSYSQVRTAATLSIIAALSLLQVPPAIMAAECHLDQRQTRSPGVVQFGGRVMLGQTFIPAVAGQRVCRIKVTITKNMPAGAAVTLRLVGANFAPLDQAVTIPGGAIPMGTSVQLFDFGCNGAPLAGLPFYGLQLESPTSPFGAYSWKGAAGNPYVKPGNGGSGWRNANAGEGQWNNLGGWDYAFEIYMCD